MVASELKSSSIAFKPETVAYFRQVYQDHKESINFKARFGNQVERAFAMTILTIAGVLPEGGQ